MKFIVSTSPLTNEELSKVQSHQGALHTQVKNIPATQSEETVLLHDRNQACITHLVSPVIQKSSDTCVTSHALEKRKVFVRQYMKEKRTNRQFREKENKNKQQKRKENLEKSRECQRRATKRVLLNRVTK